MGARDTQTRIAFDATAFSAIYLELAGAVYRCAYLRCCSSEAAEDVLQETFMALWQQPAGQAGIREWRAWLLTVARNKTTDWLRHKRSFPADRQGVIRATVGAAQGGGDADSTDRRLDLQVALELAEDYLKTLTGITNLMSSRHD